MPDIKRKALTCGVAAVCAMGFANSALAMSLPSQASLKAAAPAQTTEVAWRGWGRGWGPALGIGLAAGALTGAAPASSAYWGYTYPYGYTDYTYPYGYSHGYSDYAPVYGYHPYYASDIPYAPAYGYAYQGWPYAWRYGEPGIVMKMRPRKSARGISRSQQARMHHGARVLYAKQAR